MVLLGALSCGESSSDAQVGATSDHGGRGDAAAPEASAPSTLPTAAESAEVEVAADPTLLDASASVGAEPVEAADSGTEPVEGLDSDAAAIAEPGVRERPDAGPEPEPSTSVESVPAWVEGVPEGAVGCEFSSGTYSSDTCQLVIQCLDETIVVACVDAATDADDRGYRCTCIFTGFANGQVFSEEPFAGDAFEPCVAATEECFRR